MISGAASSPAAPTEGWERRQEDSSGVLAVSGRLQAWLSKGCLAPSCPFGGVVGRFGTAALPPDAPCPCQGSGNAVPRAHSLLSLSSSCNCMSLLLQECSKQGLLSEANMTNLIDKR